MGEGTGRVLGKGLLGVSIEENCEEGSGKPVCLSMPVGLEVELKSHTLWREGLDCLTGLQGTSCRVP